MLYGEFKKQDLECDDCPLKENEICTGGYQCYGGEPIEPPCCMFDDDTDMEEWVKKHFEWERKREELEDRRIRAKAEKDAKNKIAQEKRRASQWHVRAETREITSLKKRIRSNESIMRFASSFASALNFANECFEYKERYEPKNKKPLEIENEQLSERIKEIEKIKKQKLKEFNKQRKLTV